ncbi:hypothetical protein [Flexithrix dorotheae]|uniref:hypothetical protein n=1 Tax=Flexithrix dorotheae TaxID=70993 RepID=UPI00035ED100|nr:hypothetical protein [Flexithrix dorotheae]
MEHREPKDIQIKYIVESQLHDDEFEATPDKYLTIVRGNIYQREDVFDMLDLPNLIGKIQFSIIHTNYAIIDDFNLEEVFDYSEAYLSIMDKIYDIDKLELVDKIVDFYGDFFNEDFLIFERLEIIKSHRKKGIGRLVINEVLRRFGASCGLCVAKIFPLQFEPESSKKTEWNAKMDFQELPDDLEYSTFKLKAHYLKIGKCDEIEGLEGLIFKNPIYR